ncbi:hypothetical protein A7U60_g2002 [Sanghuangporus baumii]|uniref:Protein kinase domain-containing protein n=1 Tax=Sanghuangporus baumii TaxID=108892 RepID=A0A9Q5I301_SANBA|nr:hypothetical protein A7U60_g2002 [Sanghuangporus baumii]
MVPVPKLPNTTQLACGSSVMPSIQEANRDLSKAWDRYEMIRQEHFALLEDSDDDDPFVRSAEEYKAQLQLSVRTLCRKPKNIFSRLGYRIPLKESASPIDDRNFLKGRIQDYTNLYAATTSSRKESTNTSDLSKHAFNTPFLSDSFSLTTIQSDYPRFCWKLRFRQLSFSDAAVESIWSELGYSEKKFRSGGDVTGSLTRPMDMKRLSRRIVIRILERIENANLQKSPNIKHLERVAEMCRETVLYQDIFCFNIREKDLQAFQEIVEYTVPIVFLVSEVIHLAWSVMHQNLGIAGNYRVESQIQKLDPYVMELRDRCFKFGQSVGFDVRKYWIDFMAGAISNTGRNDEMKKDHGMPTEDVIRSQILDGTVCKRSPEHVKELSKAIDAIVRLDGKGKCRILGMLGNVLTTSTVLLDMGLQQFTDIVYDTRNHKGEGAYADVYEMSRHGEMKPVAVKRCKPGPKSAKRVEREARNWIGLHHKHIAPLLGFVCFDVSLSLQPCLVSELYHTDLKKLVWKYGKSAGSPLEHSSYVLTEERKLKFLRDISYALEFMHASNTVHGDLRAANILVTNESLDDPSCYAVLNDFGMAEYYDDDIDQIQRLSSVNMQTSAPWLAPELFEIAPRWNSLARVSKEGDVYAFGAVFLEVVYERDPYQGSPYSIEHAKSIGELPARKEDLEIRDELHWWLMEACWESVEKRPSMVEIGKQHLDIIFKFPPEKPVRHAI